MTDENYQGLTVHAIKILDGAVDCLIQSGSDPLFIIPALVEVIVKTAARDTEHEQTHLDAIAAIMTARADARRAGGVMNMAQAIFGSP